MSWPFWKSQGAGAAGHDVIQKSASRTFPPGADCCRRRMAAQNGRTFYTPALGIPELRQAIALFISSAMAWTCRRGVLW